MKKITFTTALLASACAFGGFEGHVSSDGYVPGLQQGIFRNGGRANVNFSATCAESDRFSHTLGTILADANSSRLCQMQNELSGAIEKWEARASVLYEGEMYFEGEREYNFFGAVDNYVACQLDGDCLFCQGGRTLGPKVAVFSKTFRESGWHSIRVWIADFQSFHGARSGAIGFQGMGIGWNTNGCKIVNAATKLQWNRLLDDGSGRFLRSKVLPQKNAKQDECGPVGAKDGEVRTFGAQDGLPCEIEMAWVAGRGEVDGFWLSKDLITQRQWKNVIRDNSIEEDEQVLVLPLHLHMREEYILDFVWGLNARYTGPGRFACLSDAQWELAAKYCEGVKRRNEDYGFRVALVPAAQQVSTVTYTEGKETSVAKKLGQCDFLLNKDFKKNAKVYLCLFSASWCGPCRAEMPRIARTYADTLKADPDIELIHFSCDRDDTKAMAWAKEHDVKFPVVKPKGGNPLNLHARGIPHLFIVKADGTVLEEGHPASLFKEEKLRALKRQMLC